MAEGIQLIVANRLEHLADALAGLMQTPSSDETVDPLSPETIMVQSEGMQRWLSLTLADRNGICANVEFPFPNAFLASVYQLLGGQLPRSDPFDTDMLAFRIFSLLPELTNDLLFKPLKSYLVNGPNPVKAFQLAKKIAETFDQYFVYRPELLLAWERDDAAPSDHPAAGWQSALWRRLAGEIVTPHRARLHGDLVRRLADTKHLPDEFPRRLAIFGVSYLPPVYLQILQALGHRIPVYLFLLNPCREFWFDIVSEKQIARIRSHANPSGKGAARHPETDLHLESGNSLIASLGKLGRHFFNQVYQFDCEISDRFQVQGGNSLLAGIQQDILLLKESSPREAAQADGSIRIHACHSAMREIEVLHDQLLDIFEEYPHIQPRDVMVLTPDISAYAPYIHAVFGSAGLIPFSVADLRYLGRVSLIEGFLKLLELKTSRFEVSKILSLLDNPLVHQKFDLEPADLPLIRIWIREANIRWGWDPPSKRNQGLPAFAENTWRDGLDRLLMGYAMAGDGVECYDGLLPLSAVEGNERRILGNFINFMETLYKNLKDVPAAAALDGWARILRQLKDCFFNLTEQNIYEHQALNEILERLDQIHHCIANPGNDLPFEVIRQHLIALLEKRRRSGGYITGGVTFCAALPMRSIPAEVICMVGLNHDIFPRDVQEPAFNLMASNPRIGDRSQRDDDKYLFLETLVSARSVFYLSYIGRGIQDNAPIPPSVLVEELADYLSEKMGVRRDQLVCVHPLHPFSLRYFGGEDDRFFSYSMDAFQASRSLDQIKTDSAPFIDAALPEAPPSWHNCEPFDIVEFFNHPARYLLYRRLGIRFEEEGEADGDREVFTLDALGNFRLGQMLLDDYLRGRTSRQAYLAAKASGNLPHGTMGNALHQKVSQEVRAFINRLESGMGTQAAMIEPRVDFTMVGIEMSGMLDGAYENGVFHFRLGQDRPQDLIRTFISHLIAHQCPGIAPPIHSRLICKKAAWNFDEVADAGSVLEFYLNLYRQGLARPLPFFPRTSFAYAQQRLARSASPHTAMSAARRAWQGNEYAPGDSMDLYNQRCFDGKDPLTKEFEELAVGVFDPLFKAGRRQPAGPVLD